MSYDINGKTKIVGLFGCPVAHTASPEMHNAAFQALRLNFVYVPFEVKPDFLKYAVKSLTYLGIKGVNLTIPHKVKVLPYLDCLSDEARMTGAVNTVVVKEGKLYGYNTDIQGFIEDFKGEAGIKLRGEEVLVLGAGGAGRAVAIGLAKEKVKKINIANRTPSKAGMLLKMVKRNFRDVEMEYIPFNELSRAVLQSKIIINATSLGMKKGDSLPIRREWLEGEKIIYDLVYTPAVTGLLQMGRSSGARVYNGIGMLARQGAASFRMWTGRDAPLDVMLDVLKKRAWC